MHFGQALRMRTELESRTSLIQTQIVKQPSLARSRERFSAGVFRRLFSLSLPKMRERIFAPSKEGAERRTAQVS